MKRDKKIGVAILGATGMVGQKFVELLSHHPWFEIHALMASEKSRGKKYGEAMQWMMPTPLEGRIADKVVEGCAPIGECRLVFSGLDSSVAGPIEEDFAQKGYVVISNSSTHRMNPHVPLVVPEVNHSHLRLVEHQRYSPGMIVTNPNCSVIGCVTALKPLLDRFGLEKCHITTMQAISGAGYPGVASFDILDNVIPFIAGEEEKVETEPLKIFGRLEVGAIHPFEMKISAHCNRVPVMDGHLGCLSVELEKKCSFEEIVEAWNDFSALPQTLKLPSAPQRPILYHADCRHPQPKLHRHLGQGMVVSIGRLRECPLYDWKFVILSHNTVRGAAGCAILNAELLVQTGKI